MKNKKEKKIILDEKTDSLLNGFALVISFIIIGVLLQFDSSFFGEATNFIKIVFIIIGILGLFTEVKQINFKYDIKGLDNIFSGVFLLTIVFLLKNYLDVLKWINIFQIIYQLFLFLIILLSIYGFCSGILEMIYSIIKN